MIDFCSCTTDFGEYSDSELGNPVRYCFNCRKPKKEGLIQITKQALEVYGANNQIYVSVEELSELIGILTKYPRYNSHEKALSETYDKVCEEFVDVMIIMEHIKNIYALKEADVVYFLNKKLRRLQQWMVENPDFEYTTIRR